MIHVKKHILLPLIVFFILGFTGIGFGQSFFTKHGVRTIQGPKWVPDEIVVKFKPGVSEEEIAVINSRNGASLISNSQYSGARRLRIPKVRSVAEMVEIYKRNPNVEYAEPNHIARAFWIPNDNRYFHQWHLDNVDGSGINMESAWETEFGGNSGVIVAVVDTGVAYENYQELIENSGRGRDFWKTYEKAPDLADTIFVDGYDFVNDDEHPNDDEGHGTHVTGTIAQNTNNSIGVAGVAFNVSIMPVKVLDSSGSGTYTDIADGIYYAADNGAKIINMSLGGASPSITLENALAYANTWGVTMVCASGNEGFATAVNYPAAYDAYCIAVGSTRYDETVAPYSNRGASLDLTAPGGDVTVDQNGDGFVDGVLQQTFGNTPTDWGYWYYQGTSMAAPHVSGVAALLIARGVSSPDAVREALESTARDKGSLGWDPDYGWGIVDASAALTSVQEVNIPPVADAGGDKSVSVDETITFDASDSYDPDPDGYIESYEWDFGDGVTGSGATTSHVYSEAGNYIVTLTVQDDAGGEATDTAVVTVSEASVLMMMHISKIDMSLKRVGRYVNAVAIVSVADVEEAPVEGATVFGQWSGLTQDSDIGITGSNGEISFSSNRLRNPSGTFTFTVDNIIKNGWTYDPEADEEAFDSISY